MNIRDGWATEFSRKSFSVQVDETDYAKWLDEAGLPGASHGSIPLQAKYRIMRLLAASWSLADMVLFLDHNGDSYAEPQAELRQVTTELGEWKSGLKEEFG